MVRKLKKADIEVVQKLYNEEFGGSNNEIEKLFYDNNYEIFVVTSLKQVVGFVILLMVDDLAEIIDIAVQKNFRGKGFASILMEKVVMHAKNENKIGVHLEVRENNTSAIALYDKFKFEKIFVRKKYYNGTEDGIVMQLKF